MLRSMKYLSGLAVETTDGAIGHVNDFYVDDGACVLHGFRSGDSWLSGQA